MVYSAIYPLLFGEAVATCYSWLLQNSNVRQRKAFALDLASRLPTPQAALEEAKAAAEQIAWNDNDPGFPGLKDMLCSKPNPRLVKQALLKRKACLLSATHPFEISDDLGSDDPSDSDSESDAPGTPSEAFSQGPSFEKETGHCTDISRVSMCFYLDVPLIVFEC